MSKDINKFIVAGRLTRDAELTYTNTGFAITKFSIAYNRSKKENDNWIDVPCFLDCVLLGKRGENVNQYLTRGLQLFIEGELDFHQWEKDGQKRSKHQLIVDQFNFGQRPNSGGNQQQETNTDSKPFESHSDGGSFEDDIPF